MAEQSKRFLEFKLQRIVDKKPVPQGDGVVIFDEVKVVCHLIWNSRSHQLIGLAMTREELASLNDVYRFLEDDDKTKQTSYILQFLWRDLTSPFDVVGPYFTSSDPLESKFILSCILETVKILHLYGFKTSLLVCDAAAANVSVIKGTTGVHGAYGKNKVEPFFRNPFNPTAIIHWLICPSHQVCSHN